MRGGDWLQGWDLLVAYDEDSVNDYLAVAAQTERSLGIMENMNLKCPYKEFGQQKVLEIDFKLGAPLLQFIDSSSQVQVTFPLSGVYRDATDPDHSGEIFTVPTGYNLQAVTFLCYFKGQVDKDEAVTSPADAVVLFDSAAPTSQTVTIDFTISKPQVQIVDNSGNLLTDFDTVLTYMETYLEKSGLRFHLTGLANTEQKPTYDLKTGAHSLSGSVSTKFLTPRAAAFTTLQKTDHSPGAVMIWINVVGTTNNGKPDLQFAPARSGPGTNTSPVCDGHKAGIVISYDCLLSAFFEPGLEANKFSNVKAGLKDPNGGFNFTCSFPSSPINVSPYDDNDNSLGEESDTHCDGITSDMSNGSGTITFTDNGGTLAFRLSNNITWGEHHSDGHGHSGGASGGGDVVLSFDGAARWSNSADQPNQLRLDFQIPQQFTTSTENVSGHGWGEVFSGVPSNLQNLAVNIPQSSLEFGVLDYFLATNVLFPGQHFFTADDLPDGIWHPRDTLLLGNRIAKASAAIAQPMLRSSAADASLYQILKQDILSDSPSSFFGDIIASLSGDLGEVDTAFSKALASHNYSLLKGDDLGPATGIFSRDAILNHGANGDFPALQVSQSGVPDFDIRLFGAVYQLDLPTDMAQTKLTVDPHTGNITLAGVESVATAALGVDGKYHMTWSVLGNNMDVIFSSKISQDNGATTLSFDGSITRPGGTSEFKGMQVSTKSDSGSSSSSSLQVIDYIGFGLSAIGFLAWLQANKWREEDKKEGKEKTREGLERQRLTDAQRVEVKNKLQEIETFLHTSVVLNAIQPRTDGENAQLQTGLNDSVDRAVSDATAEFTDEQWAEFSSATRDGIYGPVFDGVKSAITDSTQAFFRDWAGPTCIDSLSRWVNSGILTSGRRDAIVQDVLSGAASALNTKLNNGLLGDSFVAASTVKSMSKLRSAKLAQAANNQAEVINRLKETISSATEAGKLLDFKRQDLQAKLNQAILAGDAERTVELGAEIGNLDKEIQSNVDQAREDQDRIGDASREQEEFREKSEEAQKTETEYDGKASNEFDRTVE
ncbi:hypothetical protein ABW20_dc0106786 [Dactylellina cionopaga]|nr:hypothetical protein ABW20_dc0106786 [Dactylellina cionopaga]